MKRHEIESFVKSFLLFFVSFGIFLTSLIYLDYKQKIEVFEQDIFAQMRVCSFDLECPEFVIDFKDNDIGKPLFLYEINDSLEAYFTLPTSKKYLLSITYPAEKLQEKEREILYDSLKKLLQFLGVLAIMSALFSFYVLHPMRAALMTIEEFIKDLLHDFNTPISSIVLNSALLQKDEQNKERINRIQDSAQSILTLQQNLKTCLVDLKSQKESFDVWTMINQKLKTCQKIYPHLQWQMNRTSLIITTNKDAFSRIISNLLSNAAKYNTRNGKVIIHIDKKKKTLSISDTGVGIKKPKKIFNRYYTEHKRGTGIGLHIVKKLAEELNIGVKVVSTVNQGTRFTLELANLVAKK